MQQVVSLEICVFTRQRRCSIQSTTKRFECNSFKHSPTNCLLKRVSTVIPRIKSTQLILTTTQVSNDGRCIVHTDCKFLTLDKTRRYKHIITKNSIKNDRCPQTPRPYFENKSKTHQIVDSCSVFELQLSW